MQLTLFGKFSLLGQDQPVGSSRLQGSPKLQELLAYLVVHADRPVARNAIAIEVWNELPAPQAYACACKALTKLESLINPEGPRVLDCPDGVQWDRTVNLWVDVHQFEAAFDEASTARGKSIDRASLANLLAAADLYRGPFLDGCYSPWCSEIRGLLEQKFLQLLEISMDACEKVGDYDVGIAFGLRALALEHSRESTHRRLMRLFYLAGDRTSALRQYQRCAEALTEDLGIQPGEKTVTLYKQLQAGGELPLAPLGSLPAAFHKTLTNLQALDQAVRQLQTIQFQAPADLQSLHQLG